MSRQVNRRRQLRRVLLLIQLLAPLRNGATVGELTEDVTDDLGRVHWRTVLRDLEALEAIGLVFRDVTRDHDTGRRYTRWIYDPASKGGPLFHELAESQAC